jgi:hypothetical protein
MASKDVQLSCPVCQHEWTMPRAEYEKRPCVGSKRLVGCPECTRRAREKEGRDDG